MLSPMQMKSTLRILASFIAVLASLSACLKMEDTNAPSAKSDLQKINFDILVTRDGEVVSGHRTGIMSRAALDESDKLATMNKDLPFGLVGIDFNHGELVLDNARIGGESGNYSGWFDSFIWEASDRISFSAYYPHVDQISYGSDYESFSIPYSVKETEAGPLVSKTVERAIDQLNMIPLVFQHITNDIGFKICDATPDTNLQGLIHLRKLTATNLAQAGIFVNDIVMDKGSWKKQGYYRDIVIFDGDAKVGVGSDNEKFVGFDTLVDRLSDSHRYYSIPDDIEVGKQCIKAVFDVDGFELAGVHYPPLKEQQLNYMLYGLLPDNVFVYGKQYTFHIGLDLTRIYKQITFDVAISDWETKIYENNDDF